MISHTHLERRKREIIGGGREYMEKNSVDYSAQARTNPVFMTAKTAVCLMAQAGIPDAAEIARRLGLGSAGEVSGIEDAGDRKSVV